MTMTTPHHSEPAREAVALPSEITEAQINSACLSYRHDFGLLDEHDKERLRFVAKEWLHAWRKEFAPLAPALKLSASPAPAASGGLEAVREAAKDIIASRSSTYKARNGRVMSIEDGAGEMMWIVPFDEMHALEAALAAHAATGGEAVAWRWRFRDDNPNAPWSFAAKIEDVMGIDILSEPLYAYPAPSETATGGEADPDRLLKDALFANIKAGRETAGYSGVKVDGGRIASIYFAKHDAGTSLRLAHPAPSETGVKAWQDVRDERRRQVEAEGWTPAHSHAIGRQVVDQHVQHHYRSGDGHDPQ